MPISNTPPKASNKADFVRGSENKKSPSALTDLPWEDPNVREDVRKITSLRLTEPYALKLKWLADQLPISQHAICEQAVIAAIDQRIQEVLGE